MDSSILAEAIAANLSEEKNNVPLVYGLGIMDSAHPIKVNKKHIRTYQTWRDMLKRCGSAHYLIDNPTYVGCTVDACWLHFSEFERWMLSQDYAGKSLDKDLLYPGNKLYSPTTCVFIPQELNSLLNSMQNRRGTYPLGVCYVAGRKSPYKSLVSKEGKPVCLGYFSTAAQAHKAWQLAKAELIASVSTGDSRIRVALDRRAAKLKEDAANDRITESLNEGCGLLQVTPT